MFSPYELRLNTKPSCEQIQLEQLLLNCSNKGKAFLQMFSSKKSHSASKNVFQSSTLECVSEIIQQILYVNYDSDMLSEEVEQKRWQLTNYCLSVKRFKSDYNVKETTKILSFYAFFFVLIVTLAFVYGLVEITQNLFEGSIAGPSESEISSIKQLSAQDYKLNIISQAIQIILILIMSLAVIAISSVQVIIADSYVQNRKKVKYIKDQFLQRIRSRK